MKATRILYSKKLNAGKYNQLAETASRLGKIRTETWHRYGSFNGVGVSDRVIRDKYLAEGRKFDVPARLWKATLKDSSDNIKACREAAKVKARQAVSRHTSDKKEQKRLYTLLKYNKWAEDKYLRRIMRKYWKHGRNHTKNQIVADTGCYTAEVKNNQTWLYVMGLNPRFTEKMCAILFSMLPMSCSARPIQLSVKI
ncbi:MAG: hypothetical protein GY749_36315 [Desulfobacteraceae bacterium]|nr:hypothetical protein [Desulfobacteraceae bacterium]